MVAEMGHHGKPGYLVGEEVLRAFDLVTDGYSLASSLHANSLAEVYDVLGNNGVAAVVAARVPFLIKVRMLRNAAGTHTRRVVDEINEVARTDGGEPAPSLLYRWDGELDGVPASWTEESEGRGRGRRRG